MHPILKPLLKSTVWFMRDFAKAADTQATILTDDVISHMSGFTFGTLICKIISLFFGPVPKFHNSMSSESSMQREDRLPPWCLCVSCPVRVMQGWGEAEKRHWNCSDNACLCYFQVLPPYSSASDCIWFCPTLLISCRPESNQNEKVSHTTGGGGDWACVSAAKCKCVLSTGSMAF